MAWNVVMYGTLTVPERNLEDWLTTRCPAESFPFLEELGGNDVAVETPEGLLAFFSDAPVAPHEFLDVSQIEGQVVVRAFVNEDTWRDTCQPLAQLFASAAAFGGHGTLVMAGYQGIRFGEQLTVEKGEAVFSTLGPEALSAVERAPAYKAVDERIHSRFDGLVGRPDVPLDPRRSRWAVHPFTGRKVRVAADA